MRRQNFWLWLVALFLLGATPVIFSSSIKNPRHAFVSPSIVINEVVTDPQQDWNDSAGGNGVPFDDTPGTGTVTETDEWVELFNSGAQAIDLTGWSIEFINGTNSTLDFSNPGSTELRFSAGGSVTNFQPGEYLVIGNPPGGSNNDIYIVLKDATGAVVDEVEIGDDFENDGAGDGAPDGGTSDGNAAGVNDEAVARFPNGADTDNDVNDFSKQAATIGASNGDFPSTPPVVVINEIVTDPQQDWSDNAGGNGIAFDDIPGNGSITDTDEWVELFNAGTESVNLVLGSGWTMEFINGSNSTLSFSNPGTTELRFSAGGSVTNFQPGEYLVIGNPPGGSNNDIYIVLKDARGAVVDEVEIGDDFENDGAGDGAPDGGTSDGNAAGINDEAVARFPDAVDTGNDVNDFKKQAATIGASNGIPFCELSIAPAAHDFGEVEQGLFADTIFVLSNDSSATDTCIGNVSLVGDPDFSLVSARDFSILPGETHEIIVRFDCREKEPGHRSAKLLVISNDPDTLEAPLAGVCVAPPPCQAEFVASARFGVAPFTVEFTDLSTGPIDSYLWDFGDGTSSTERHPKHTYNAECRDPQFTVRLMVSGRCGQDMATKTNYILVHPPSECAFYACPTGGAPPLRVGFVNQLTDYATGYLWNFGDGSTSTEVEPVHLYTQPGIFDVSLTIQTDLGSATVTFDDYINVQPHFVAPEPMLLLNGPDFGVKSAGGEEACGWTFWTNGFISHNVTISGDSRWFVMEVVATGSFAGGEWPKLQFVIDEVIIGEQIIASPNPRTYRFVAPLNAGTHSLKLAFPNDFFDPVTGNDRNLSITRLLVFDSGAPLPAPGRLNAADMTIRTHGDSLGKGAWNLYSNGFLGHGLAIADSGDYVLQVKASAHDANGEGPKLVVRIDGVAQDTVEVPAGLIESFIFPLALAKGNHFLQLEFINNFFDPVTREDRNLILREFTVSRVSPPQASKVAINEVVTDPQQDWNDSAGGNGIAFDAIPGNGAITETDEWVELYNAGSQAVNLVSGSGWTIELINGSNVTLNFSNPGSTVLRFSAGGSVANFQPGEYLVIGNPPGASNNDVFIVLKDETGAVVDKVEIGDDFENDGAGDGAPDGGTSDGNATGINDEAVARFPNGADTDNDVNDFSKQAATIGASNGEFPSTPPVVVINEIVTDPQQDWSDSAGGNGIAFDDIPGNGAVTDTDEWIELVNAGTEAVNLILGSGWTLEFINGTTSTLNFSNLGAAELRFSAGGSITNFQPGEFLVIGNPPGASNNDVFIVLKDETGAVVDKVEIGDDFENDGNGDGAPDGGASDGNATGINDEAVARHPNAVDTDDDVADFVKQAATIGVSNDSTSLSPGTTGVHNAMTAAPEDFKLIGNYPNPFNPSTLIKFGVPEPARVMVTIHNVTGQEVTRLLEEELAAGEYEREWNAAGYVSGIYFARLVAISKTSNRQVELVKKMVLAK
jgi:PKD repeat protein